MRVWALTSTVALFALSAAQPALAQSMADGATGSGPGGEQSGREDTGVARATGDEIIVTAQKREQSLQDVPIAIAAVSTEALSNANITSTNDLATVVPSLNVTRTTEAVNFTLRGIGTQGGSTGQDSAIATFVDGVYIPSMAGSNFALGNIERVEVLKGPQGTLYGRNATGGAVNVITRDPSFTPTMNASMGYGNYQTMESAFYGSTGLSDTIAADLAVYYRYQDKGFGFNRVIQRDVNRSSDLIVRGKLIFVPTETTKVTIAGDWARVEGSIAIAYRPVPTSQLLDGRGYTSFLATGNGYYDSISEFEPATNTQSYGGYARIDQDLGNFKLTNIFAYRGAKGFQRTEVDATSLKIIDAPLFSEESQYTNELQLSYSAGKINAIAGVYYLDGTSQYNPFQIVGLAISGATGGLADRTVINSRQRTKSYAAFGQMTWEFLEDTNLTLGARYTIDERRLDAAQFLDLGSRQPTPYGEFLKPNGLLVQVGAFNQSKTFKKPTWRIALDHQFTPDLMAYASFSRGFKSGVFNLTSPGDPAAEPETLDAYEVGIKTSPAPGFTFNVAAFHYKYANIQAFQVNGANTTLTNATGARIYGIEADFTARLGGGFRVSGGASYLDHKYGSFPIATISFLSQPAGAPNYPGYTPGLGNYVFPNCSNPAFSGQFYCSASGNKLVNTPDFTANLAISHELQLPRDMSIQTSLAYAYNDGFFWAVDNRVRQDAYHNLNAQIQFNGADERYFVRAWVKNLIDEKYLVAVNQNGSGDIGTPAPPRTYGGTIGFKF
jgi:iron complex outermembrane receptor protein